jgi:hypothetical protein
MKIEDILQALPSREDIINAVGLETRQSKGGEMVSAFGIFGTGLMLGAGLALLFAPKVGREVRQEIAEKVDELSEALRAQMPKSVLSTDAPRPE